ncbi:MAG: PQQ-like beta-propeller repeat protein [Planctomycetes bacterium]|nr:PQQ-like beta-propeller repeat protein [Planctomycetota bacterium]
MRRFIAIFGLILAVCATARADDTWPQFRGPGGQGHAQATGLPTAFSESENVVWRCPLPGEGWSSPVSDGRTIWMTTAVPVGEDKLSLRALAVDVASGKLVHEIELLPTLVAVPKNTKNSHASPTPVLEADRLYTHFGTYGSACVDTKTGKVLWTNTDLPVDHKEGPGSSPIIYGELMIFHGDGTDVQFIAALNKSTGKLAWKTARSAALAERDDFRKGYCTPLVINVGGRDLLVSPAAWHVFAYEPLTGKEVWVFDYQPGFSNVPRPLFGHGLLYICSGYNKTTLYAIRPEGVGNITETNAAWKFPKAVPQNPSPLLIGDLIYMVADKGIASCVDAKTGESVWTERLGGNFSASPVFADGKIYFGSEEGKFYVLAPGREYKLLAENQLGARHMASPMVLGRALYLRTDAALYRLEQGGAPAAAQAKN